LLAVMDDPKRFKLISEGILVAGFTLLSYLLAYQYEYGFCSYWQIPEYFITISVTTAVAAGLSVVGAFILLIIYVNIPVMLLEKELSEGASYKKFIIIVHIIFFGYLVVKAMGYGVSGLLAYVLAFLFIDIFVLFIPWLKDKRMHPEKVGFFERIVRQDKKKREPKDTLDWLFPWLDRKAYIIIFFIIILMSEIAPAIGRKNARPPRKYLVTESNKLMGMETVPVNSKMLFKKQQLILIKKYGDSYILRPIDLETNKVKNKIVIWESEELASCQFMPKYFKSFDFSKE